MKRRIKRTWQRKSAVLGAALMGLSGGVANALPQGGEIQSGAAEIHQDGKNMTIDQSTNRVAIDWKSFDIARDEGVRFNQPGFDSIALNRITGGSQSVIDGLLSANGHIFLVNPNGVLFGNGSQIDVGGLIASTARVTDQQMLDFGGNKKSAFSLALEDGNTASILNEGEIRAQGGLVALHAASVINNGTITNEGGKIALASAKQVELSADDANKINFVVDGSIANAKVINTGALSADSGYVLMTAKGAGDAMSSVVNNEGVVEANTAREGEEGQIILDSDKGTTDVSGTLSASGTAAGTSGGKVTLLGGTTNVKDGAKLLADGAVNGGKIETSGDVVNFGAFSLSAAGKTGKAGEWLIDPLEVVISDTEPTAADSTLKESTSSSASQTVTNDTDDNQTTWIKTSTVEKALNAGTGVTIEAADKNKAASITVEKKSNSRDAIRKLSGGDAFLTLKAQRNITINGNIRNISDDGKLDVTLHTDTDGDAVGATILNGNIDTNGGDVTIGSGTDLTNGTTGLYVGPNPLSVSADTEYRNRAILTNGGAVNIYGDVAIGLNGNTFTIDTTKQGSNVVGGTVNISGNVGSGNAYHTYSYGTYTDVAGMNEEWLKLVSDYMTNHPNDYKALLLTFPSTLDTVHAAYGNKYFNFPKKADGTYDVTVKDIESALIYYAYLGTIHTTTEEHKALTNGIDLTVTMANDPDKVGQGLDAATAQGRKAWMNKVADAVLANGGDKTKLIARAFAGWYEGARALATDDKGGTNVGHTYLATITSALENSVVSQGKEVPTFVGGRGWARSDNATGGDKVTHDSLRNDGYYWTEGPEGEAAGNEKGLHFTDAQGNAINGYYVNWNGTGSKTQGKAEVQPDGSGAYLTIGYGFDSKWDDVANMTGTIMGFTQETNLAHSGLQVQSGSGDITVGGSLGETVNLSNVGIASTGAVKIGADAAKNGHINADAEVKIQANSVEIAGRTTSKDGNVDITGVDSVDVNGVTAGGKIALRTTGHEGVITLDSKNGDGSIVSGNNEDDAVVVDVKGSQGKLVNKTTSDKAITTGKDGTWKVYSASPELDEFGTNLNSEANAQWHASSSGSSTNGTKLDEYATTKAGNKFIFQTHPVVTIAAQDMEKTYGETKSKDDVKTTVSTTYTGANGETLNIDDYKNAFQETATNYTTVSGQDMFKSKGFEATATRNAGDSVDENGAKKTASDGKNAIYAINANQGAVSAQNGYKVEVKGADLTVNRAGLTIDTTGKTTYGDGTITATDRKTSGFVNGDEAKVSYADSSKDGGEYDTALQQKKAEVAAKGGDASKVTTPDAGKYEDSISTSLNGKDANGGDIADNYDITSNGTLTVEKAVIPSNPTTPGTNTPSITGKDKDGNTVNMVDGKPIYTTTYGDGSQAKNVTLHGVNGDGDVTVGFTTDATVNDPSNPNKKTNDVGKYDTTVDLGDLSKNYTFETPDAGTDGAKKTFADTAEVTKAQLTVTTNDAHTTYGTAFDKTKYDYTVDTKTVRNGDDASALKTAYGTLDHYVNTGDGTDGKITQNAGDDYIVTGVAGDQNILKNYDVTIDSGKATIDKAKITVPTDPSVPTTDGTPTIDNNGQALVDGSTVYETTYGRDDMADKTVTLHGVNNDGTIKVGYTTDALTGNTTGKVTNNAGNGYSTTITLTGDAARNYEFVNADGTTSSSKTVANSATVNKADLKLKMGDTSATYGGKFSPEDPGYTVVDGITNGDTETGVRDEIGNNIKTVNGGLGENGKATKDANTYKVTGEKQGTLAQDDLQNYNVTIKDGTSTVTKARVVLPTDPTNPGTDPSTPTIDNNGKGIVDGNTVYETTYGKDSLAGKDKTVTLHGVNDDGNIEVKYTTDALTGNTSGKVTNNAGSYSTTIDLGENAKNYTFVDENGKEVATKTVDNTAKVNKADLKLKMGDTSATYGGKFSPEDPGYTVVSGITNDDTDAGIRTEIGDNIKTINGGVGENGRATQDAGDYKVTGEKQGTLKDSDLTNYNVKIDDGKSTVNKAVINLPGDNGSTDPNGPKVIAKTGVDGDPLYSTEYGKDGGDKTVTITGVNGDGDFTADITGTTALTGNDTGRVTNNVTRDSDGNVTNGYNTTVKLRDNDNGTDWTKNYTFVTDGGETTEKTFDNTARVTPHEVTYTTNDITTTYGTPKVNEGSNIAGYTNNTGAVNGDSFDNVGFKYNDFGGGYVDGNGNNIDPTTNSDVSTYRTNNVKDGGYTVSSEVTGPSDITNNYTFKGTDGTLTINPKTVNYTVDGKTDPNGNTTYTVTPKNDDGTNGTPGTPGSTTPIEDQFVPGGTTPSITFTPGGQNPDGSTKVITVVDGKEVTPGGTSGNYTFNYDGNITNNGGGNNNGGGIDNGNNGNNGNNGGNGNGGNNDIEGKIDQNPKNPSNVNGTGSITDNRNGNGGIAGVDRVLGLADAQLPFFKNVSGSVLNYGSFDVSVDPDTVKLSPVAKRIPEPNQPKTQYREYTTQITTSAGTGEYKMTYDGSRFIIAPMDAAARVAVLAGDATKNVELSSQALHIGFADMGLVLEGIDAVYVNFN